MAVTPVTCPLGCTVIGQKASVSISFTGGKSVSLHLPASLTLYISAASPARSLWCSSGCVIRRVSGGGLSSCQSVGQVHFGSWGTVMGWGPATMSVWWRGCTPPVGLSLHAIILLLHPPLSSLQLRQFLFPHCILNIFLVLTYNSHSSYPKTSGIN